MSLVPPFLAEPNLKKRKGCAAHEGAAIILGVYSYLLKFAHHPFQKGCFNL